MTLDELAAPYGRRRVIRYGAGGNKVVRRWDEVQHVVGSLYRGRSTQDEYGQTECNLFIFFPDVKDGLLYQDVAARIHELYCNDETRDRAVQALNLLAAPLEDEYQQYMPIGEE